MHIVGNNCLAAKCNGCVAWDALLELQTMVTRPALLCLITTYMWVTTDSKVTAESRAQRIMLWFGGDVAHCSADSIVTVACSTLSWH